MKKSKNDATQKDESPSRLIDARIRELGDWRGETLARIRSKFTGLTGAGAWHNRPDAQLELLHEFAIEDHETAAELDRAAREPAD